MGYGIGRCHLLRLYFLPLPLPLGGGISYLDVSGLEYFLPHHAFIHNSLRGRSGSCSCLPRKAQDCFGKIRSPAIIFLQERGPCVLWRSSWLIFLLGVPFSRAVLPDALWTQGNAIGTAVPCGSGGDWIALFSLLLRIPVLWLTSIPATGPSCPQMGAWQVGSQEC